MGDGAEVVVVGGGINGLSVALHLAREGASRVVVIERSQLGAGATGKSGGMVRTHHCTEAETELALEGLRDYRQWGDVVGGDCGFRAVGLLVIAPPERKLELQRNIDLQRRLGIESDLISAAEAREIDPALELPAAVTHVAYEPGAGYVDPNLAVRTLAAAAVRAGVTIRVGVEVGAVLHAQDRVTGVITDEGLVSAPTVVVAAGAWANRVLGPLGIDLGVRPAIARVAVFPAPPARRWPHPTYLDDVRRSWYRPVAGAATLAGVEPSFDRHPPVEAVGETVDERFVGTCADALTERFPVMSAAGSRGGWTGAYMDSPDSRPVVGPLPPYDGLFAVTGDSGSSFKTAPAIGRRLAELIARGRSSGDDLAPFRAERFLAARTPTVARIPQVKPRQVISR